MIYIENIIVLIGSLGQCSKNALRRLPFGFFGEESHWGCASEDSLESQCYQKTFIRKWWSGGVAFS